MVDIVLTVLKNSGFQILFNFAPFGCRANNKQ